MLIVPILGMYIFKYLKLKIKKFHSNKYQLLSFLAHVNQSHTCGAFCMGMESPPLQSSSYFALKISTCSIQSFQA